MTEPVRLTYPGATIDTLLETVNGSNLSATHKITRSATIVIAASDSSAKSKAQADYVCEGTADNVEIQAALDAIKETGGTVYLTEGNYNILNSISPGARTASTRNGRDVILRGASTSTILHWVGSVDGVVIDIPNAWGFTCENLTIDGNSQTANGIRIYGTETQACRMNIFRNIKTRQCKNAWWLGYNVDSEVSEVAINSFYDLQIDESITGIYFHSFNCNQNRFYGGEINACTNAIYCYYSGVNYFHNYEITACTTVLRKKIIGLIYFIGLTEESNDNFFANEEDIAASDGALVFLGCLLQSPATYDKGSFLKIISIGCVINQEISLTWDTKWDSIQDVVLYGSVDVGSYGRFSTFPDIHTGTATATGDVTSITVSHGYGTPHVFVTAKQLGQGNYAVTAVTNRTFTLEFEVAPGSNTWSFDWAVIY